MQNENRFTEAFLLAADLHQHQQRRGNDAPYISHLMAVAAIVMRFGGDEDEVISALLHDAVEDQGGQKTLEIINERFGARVADIVIGCSDTDQFSKPPWKERKLGYLEHLRNADESTLMVSAADKLHNALDSLVTHDEIGAKLWDFFRADRDDTRWYYEQIGLIYQQRKAEFPRLHLLLEETIKAIQALVNVATADA